MEQVFLVLPGPPAAVDVLLVEDEPVADAIRDGFACLGQRAPVSRATAHRQVTVDVPCAGGGCETQR
jgi:hypothetical protein